MFWLILGHFWCSVITLVTLSSDINNFVKPKKIKDQKKQIKNLKDLKN